MGDVNVDFEASRATLTGFAFAPCFAYFSNSSPMVVLRKAAGIR